MKSHMTSEEISAAVAGLDLEPDARQHFESCVACRAAAADLEQLLDARRAELHAAEPDWGVQAQQIMARLPATAAGSSRRPSPWMRPVLALAAILVVAVGLAILRSNGPVERPVVEPTVEEILAEMDELLSDDGIPGFEIIDPWIDDRAMDFGNIEPTASESVG
jgi:hypothetical protein